MKVRKPYKDAEPLDTINKVRTILEKLNIFTIESHRFSEGNLFCSTRVKLGNPRLHSLDIGTNGKGLTPEYALASAYGELMERLQNHGLFVNTHLMNNFNDVYSSGKSLDFSYMPDEEFVLIDQLIKFFPVVFSALFGTNQYDQIKRALNTIVEDSKILTVPFYHLNSNKECKLPISLISHFCSTNGMCAGNTYEEAILQGLCEVIERYVIKQIYLYDITPPDIPFDYFKNSDIYQKILQLESEFQYKIIVKDCSLGESWPVVGVLIINQADLTYRFKLGSDTNIETAIERCLTEIYQGLESNPTFCRFSLTQNPFKSRTQRVSNYYKTIIDGTGCYPQSIFRPKPTYSFEKCYVTTAGSSSEDLKQLSAFVISKGKEIFIRDNSFLNFPSFLVYIPGMSELNYIWSEPNERIESISIYNNSDLMLKLNRLNRDGVKDLIELIARVEDSEMFEEFIPHHHFLYNTCEELKELLPDLFKVMVFYKNGNYEKAYNAISQFTESIPDNSREDYTYYFTIRSYLKMMLEGYKMEKIKEDLPFFHGDEAYEVLEDFSNADEIFKYFALPDCFECKKCDIRNSCMFFDVMEIYSRIKHENSKNVLNQLQLSCTFNTDTSQN